MKRRTFVKGVAGTAAASTLAGVSGCGGAASGGRPGRRVAVLGGGCAGLSAAHELAERGFQVTVYEKKDILGGKCRTIPLENTGFGGRRDLPGEHGYRFFPGYYKHITDTMSRIPFSGNRRGVKDNLSRIETVNFSRADGRDLVLPYQEVTDFIFDFQTLADFLLSVISGFPKITLNEARFFVQRLLEYATACKDRRLNEYDKLSWAQFCRADKFGADYDAVLVSGLTRNLVAAQAHKASTRTIGIQAMQIFVGNILLSAGEDAGRVLNAPSTEAWIDPWYDYLAGIGVEFHNNTKLITLNMAQGEIAGAVVEENGVRRTITADYYVLAVPAEVASKVITQQMRNADPQLNGIDQLVVDWMTGVQYFLNENVNLSRGFYTYIDSPWAVSSISPVQFWRNKDFGSAYGDGSVKGFLTVDVSDWDTPGMLYGKPAKDCTREEIFRETWEQIKAHVNDVDSGRNPVLRDDMILEQFLDPAIKFGADGTPEENEEPLLVNTVGSFSIRPEAVTKIPNFFLASDYVRNNTDLATMEGANEAARAAVNGILALSDSTAKPCKIWPLGEPAFLLPFKEQDVIRYRLGLKHILAFDR